MGIIQLLITLLIFCLDESANYGTPTIRRYVALEMAKEVEMEEMGEKKVAKEESKVGVNVRPPGETENDDQSKKQLCNEDNDIGCQEEKRSIEARSFSILLQ